MPVSSYQRIDIELCRVKSLVREWDSIKDGPEPPNLTVNTAITLGHGRHPSERLRTISSSSERSDLSSASPQESDQFPSSSSTARIASAPVMNRRQRSRNGDPSLTPRKSDMGALRAAAANSYGVADRSSNGNGSASDSAQEGRRRHYWNQSGGRSRRTGRCLSTPHTLFLRLFQR